LFRPGDIRRVPPNPLTCFLTKPLEPRALKGVQYSEVTPDEWHFCGFIRAERTLGPKEMQAIGAWQGECRHAQV